MSIVGMIVNNLLWFIAGGVFISVFAAGFSTGFCCNDKELKEIIDEDELIKEHLTKFYYYPGYEIGKRVAIWINRYE